MTSPSDSLTGPIKEFLLGTTSLTLSEIAGPFLQMFEEPQHFQIALSVLLPMMNNQEQNMELRIQAAFLLWYLYRNHSLDMNPFTGSFRETLQTEEDRSRAVNGALESATDIHESRSATMHKESVLALTLKAILSGGSSELELYSPERLVNQWPLSIDNTSRRTLASSTGQEDVDEINVARQLLLYATEATLSLSEQRTLVGIMPVLHLPFPGQTDDSSNTPFPLGILNRIVANNPGNTAYAILSHIIATSTEAGRQSCWEVLRDLQPTLANFDVVTRLLRDDTTVNPWDTGGNVEVISNIEEGDTVGRMVRTNVLNAFLEHCDMVIEHMEVEERGTDGRMVELDPNGACTIAVQNFCRFCLALLRSGNEKSGVVWGHEMGEDDWFGMTTIMRSFALRYVRFEAGSELYAVLARRTMGRGG